MIRHPGLTVVTLCLVLLSSALFLFCGRNDEPTGPGGETGTVTLIAASSPDGAEIFIDNVSTGGRTPDTLSTMAGSHTIKLELCDYDDWTMPFQGSDGDTLKFNTNLDLTFEFFDDFENGAENWTAGCPFSFEDSTSYDGSNSIIIINDGVCSTQLIPTFELPSCLEPSVSFWYKLPGPIIAGLRIDTEAGSHYEQLADSTIAWTIVEIPAESLKALVGTATFTFEFNPTGDNPFRFSLDDFSISAE